MEYLLLWAIGGVVVGMIASSKGENFGLWFLYGALIWPVALVHILTKPATVQAEQAKGLSAGRRPCPHCAEMILPAAVVCRFCGKDVEPLPVTEPTTQTEPRTVEFAGPVGRQDGESMDAYMQRMGRRPSP